MKDVHVIDDAEFWNDAELLGQPCPEYDAMLQQEAALTTGQFYAAGNRRNTQDGEWESKTLRWGDWLEGGKGWGLTRHIESKHKVGSVYVYAATVEKARTAKAVEKIYALALDIDSGTSLDAVLDRIEELGLFAIVSTSHSHGKDEFEISRDELVKLFGTADNFTDDQIQTFLREHSKQHYDEDFLASVTVKEVKRTKSGSKIVLKSAPLDKFRLIFPLSVPVDMADLGATDQAALALFESKIVGLAVDMLGAVPDLSATDPCRMMYAPRHPKGADYYAAVVRGRPLTFEEVPTLKKSDYTKRRSGAQNVFTDAGEGADTDSLLAPSGRNLKALWHDIKDRLMIADLIEDECPDKLRDPTGKQGWIQFECPFERDHSEEGGNATFAVNALDSSTGNFQIGCNRNSCKSAGHGALDYLAEMLRQGWFEEELLNDDSIYMLEPGEEVTDTGTANADGTARPVLDITAPLGSTLKDAVQSLNERFAAVNLGGGLRFIRRPDHSIQGEDNMEVWTRNSLKEFYEDQKVKGADDKYVNPVDRFAATAKRHSRADFAPPGYDVPATTYNLFRGFSMTPVQGDCTILKHFIRDVVCDGDAEAFKWLWLWMAHMIQRPGEKPGTAVVVHGAGGAGKGTFGELLHKLVHPYSMTAQHKEHVVGKFAGVALTFSILCHAEEALFAGNPEIADTLKTKVTKEWEQVEPKGQQSFTAHSCTRYYIDSNHKAAVNIEGNGSERRFFVLQVSEARRGDMEYFEQVYAALEGPEMAALAYELMQYDPASAGMKWRNVRIAPETRARQLMGYQSRSVVERSLLDVFNEGEFKLAGEGVEYTFNLDAPTRVGSTHLKEFLKRDGNRYHADDRDPLALMKAMFGDAVAVGRAKGMFSFTNKDGETEKKNTHFFEFPALRELFQAMFAKGYRVSPDPDEEKPEEPGAAYGP